MRHALEREFTLSGANQTGVGSLSQGDFSLWDYYLTSMEVGFRGLSPAHLKFAAGRIINPLSYPRLLEYQLVTMMLGSVERCKILDIGSPKLLALLLALRTESELHSIDIQSDFVAPWSHFLRKMGQEHKLGKEVVFETQDARALTYPDQNFDKVFSISVIEHIPDQGDSQAMAEIARVLRPGGVAVITVPYSFTGYKEESVGGGVYERKAIPGERTFYQRYYDEASLGDRLITPSGLDLQDIVYFGEPGMKIEPVWNQIPMKWKIPLLPFQPFVAQKFFKPLSKNQIALASGVAIKLQKTAGNLVGTG